MQKKLLVRLDVPALSDGYDILIPDFLPVGELMKLIIESVTDLSQGAYMSSGEEILICREKNTVLGSKVTLAECGILNGDHLVMI